MQQIAAISPNPHASGKNPETFCLPTAPPSGLLLTVYAYDRQRSREEPSPMSQPADPIYDSLKAFVQSSEFVPLFAADKPWRIHKISGLVVACITQAHANPPVDPSEFGAWMLARAVPAAKAISANEYAPLNPVVLFHPFSAAPSLEATKLHSLVKAVQAKLNLEDAKQMHGTQLFLAVNIVADEPKFAVRRIYPC